MLLISFMRIDYWTRPNDLRWLLWTFNWQPYQEFILPTSCHRRNTVVYHATCNADSQSFNRWFSLLTFLKLFFKTTGSYELFQLSILYSRMWKLRDAPAEGFQNESYVFAFFSSLVVTYRKYVNLTYVSGILWKYHEVFYCLFLREYQLSGDYVDTEIPARQAAKEPLLVNAFGAYN